jgi:hypothetical protein
VVEQNESEVRVRLKGQVERGRRARWQSPQREDDVLYSFLSPGFVLSASEPIDMLGVVEAAHGALLASAVDMGFAPED